MVERAAAGEVPSSPQPPEAGARAGPGFTASRPPQRIEAERQCHQAGAGLACGRRRSDPASADFKHVVDLSLAARRGLTASLCTLDLLLADM